VNDEEMRGNGASPGPADRPLPAPEAAPEGGEATTRAAGGGRGKSSRYEVVAGAEGEVVASVDAPNIHALLRLGETAAKRSLKRYPRQTIFLDGAFGGAPFLDNKRRQYSLDHHAGVVRILTLATCEQAAAMVYHGLPLAEGEWLLVLNGLDLDSLLAVWILVNHAELRRDGNRLLGRIMPLVRTEGVIDAHGLDAGVLTALDPETLAAAQAQIKALLPFSRAPAGAGEREALEGAVAFLERLDSLLLPAAALAELARIVETGRVPLTRGRLAIACRSGLGVYEVEEHYKSRYGSAFGILLLDRGGGQYTIRLSSGFFDANIDELYAKLNKLDPAASSSRDGENRWGGSTDIGGSPRLSGSQLESRRILDAIGEVYGERPAFLARILGLVRRRRSSRSTDRS